MKLATYLETHQITAADFGRQIGASRSAVARWARDLRTPDRDAMQSIARVTNGAVTANDFFDIPDTTPNPPARRSAA